jgi:hypothetical protein
MECSAVAIFRQFCGLYRQRFWLAGSLGCGDLGIPSLKTTQKYQTVLRGSCPNNRFGEVQPNAQHLALPSEMAKLSF